MLRSISPIVGAGVLVVGGVVHCSDTATPDISVPITREQFQLPPRFEGTGPVSESLEDLTLVEMPKVGERVVVEPDASVSSTAYRGPSACGELVGPGFLGYLPIGDESANIRFDKRRQILEATIYNATESPIEINADLGQVTLWGGAPTKYQPTSWDMHSGRHKVLMTGTLPENENIGVVFEMELLPYTEGWRWSDPQLLYSLGSNAGIGQTIALNNDTEIYAIRSLEKDPKVYLFDRVKLSMTQLFASSDLGQGELDLSIKWGGIPIGADEKCAPGAFCIIVEASVGGINKFSVMFNDTDGDRAVDTHLYYVADKKSWSIEPPKKL